MQLREVLSTIQQVSSRLPDVPPVMICGGTVRDKYMHKLGNVADIDLTNGDKSIDYVSEELYNLLRKKYNVSREIAEDGHSTIFFGNLKMDFSSNFVAPHINQYLANLGLKHPTKLQTELFSRDFTCNALLMDLGLSYIEDPTLQGFTDIKNRMIKTCLSPDITLTVNKNRVLRAIYLACKLDFEVSPDIISFVKEHPETVKISTPKSTTDKLHQAFKFNPKKAAQLITEMGIWGQIPIIEPARPYYQQSVKWHNV